MNIYITILLQFFLISSGILLLFKFRKSIGLAPLYLFLGAIQYVQALSYTMINFIVFGDITIYPGSVIVFSSVLFAVLLIYIKEGVSSARTLILGIIISNFLLAAMFGIAHEQVLATQNFESIESSSLFLINYKYFFTGTVLLMFDFILLVTIYQFLISKKSRLYFFLILFISLSTVLIFDSIVFNLSLNYGSADFNRLLIGHILGKTMAALTFSCILYLYLNNIDTVKDRSTFIANQDRDIFSIINYRKKYENLKIEKERVEEELAYQLKTTLNSISDGIESLDTNWCYTYINEKACEFLDRSSKSLLGKHIWTEFPDAVGLPFYEACYKAVDTQQTQYFQEYYETFDKWLENRIYPSPEGLTIYFTDITDIKKADTHNQMLLSLIETSDDFIGLATLEGKPIYLNSNGRKLVGLETHLKTSMTIEDFFPESYQDVIKNEQIPQIFKNGKWNGEAAFKNFKTNDLLPIDMSGFLINDSTTNKPIALGIVATDITERKKAEENLINSEKLFRRLSSSAPVAIFQTDKEGSCNYVNEEWIKYAGLSFEEAMGFGWVNAIHPDDNLSVLQSWKQASQNGKDYVSEFRFQNTNKKITWLSVKAVGTYDAKNNLYGYIGIALDITERKKSEEQIIKSEKYLENIINNIGDPLFVKDSQSHLLLVNDAFCSIFNLTREDIIGKTLAENVAPDEQETFLRIDKQVISTGIENVNEESLTANNNETLIISTKKSRFIDSSGSKFLIGIIRDITDRKNTEIELEKHRNNLEELVDVRTSELEKEKVKAQSADLMKSAFLATMSHELRTPMNSIIGFTGILLQELAGPLNEEQTKQLSMVKNSGEHLLGLINDVLDISKIEAGKLKVSLYPFDYLASLERTINFLSPQVSAKGLKMSTEISEMDITLVSDERRVEQILLNLLSNAIKFSKQGTILIKVDIKDHFLTTQVIDQGIGISKDNLLKLFMPFIQLEVGLSRNHEGTGLGLAICKNLIEKLGGTIHIESVLGKGSNVTFKLPLENSDKK